MRAVIAILVVLALAAPLVLAATTPVDFVLHYTGSLKNGHVSLKGPSVDIRTSISPTDAIKLEVKTMIGSFSQITADETSFANKTYSTVGNITFGIHQFRDTHVLYFRTVGLGYLFQNDNQDTTAVTIWEVIGGKGAFDNATGTVSVSCRVVPSATENLYCFAIGAVYVPKKAEELLSADN
eukprot:TRINITY_DN179_c0_g1_i1.p1 TRINITY_DN179_c0_g1~~TRINITY_DN179_c0_g1_i1.p1  ORF type:complete len:181 (+),score=30.28 TRINITY_DN179_c0_g1_i1:102-644(+)